MWHRRMTAFLRSKGQILWDDTVNTTYVHPINFLPLGSRDMHDANNKSGDWACRIWEVLTLEMLRFRLSCTRLTGDKDHVWFEDQWMVASLCDE
jgi:hypothetical protein